MGAFLSFETSVNWSPFDNKTSYQLGLVENWPRLRRILDVVVNRKFVTDVASQALIDEVRSVLDSSYGEVAIPHVPLTKRHILSIVIYAEKDEAVEILELLLATGMDPDKPSDNNWRPSHYCGFVGRLDLASSLFLCRPNMAAKNSFGHTPLHAAQVAYPGYDRHYKAWNPRRRFVAKFIENDFPFGFPTLAELAVQKKWFAIKNLVRRQAAASHEFTEALNGLTAAGWASHYGEKSLADEIRYYQQPLTTRFARASEELLSLTKKNSSLRKENSSLATENASLKMKVEKLETESKEKDSKMAELSEAVELLTSRLGRVEVEATNRLG